MRALISLTTRSAIIRSRSLSCSPRRNSAASAMDRSHTAEMLCPPMVTASDDGLRRAPSQAGHGTSRMYVSICSRLQSLSESACRRLRNGITPS